MPEAKKLRPQKVKKKGAEFSYRWAWQTNTSMKDEDKEEKEIELGSLGLHREPNRQQL